MIDKRSLRNISESKRVLIRQENFAYLLPCEQLRNYISNFTVSFPDPSTLSDAYSVMPHGSVTLVLFSYKTELYSFLFGPTTKPHKVGDIANKCDVICIIEFQPAGFFPFTQINQRELTDRILPLSSIDPILDDTMRNILSSSLSLDALILAFENKLMQSIRILYPKALAQAMQAVIQTEGVMTSMEIAKHVFYSPRQLNRMFNFYLGMGMKAFSRLVRINKSIQLLNEKTNTLAFICEKLGYYDLSHFVKDFKMVCAVTPQEYRTNMSDFYSEIAKF